MSRPSHADADFPSITRRRFGIVTGGALGALAFGNACEGWTAPAQDRDGRLTTRVKSGVKTTAPSGMRPLGLSSDRDGVLQLPPNAAAKGPLPLLILLHGAGSSGDIQLKRLGSAPDDAGVAVLAPDSRDVSWDAIRGSYGPDIRFLNSALARVFDTVNVDPARLTLGGFSDGATYAISLGLINGDLFPRVIGFSAGFVIPGSEPHGHPRFFMSHGTNDDVLPIDRCGRVIAKDLKARGFDVTFREFVGGHQVTPAIVTEAMTWITTA